MSSYTKYYIISYIITLYINIITAICSNCYIFTFTCGSRIDTNKLSLQYSNVLK